MKVTCIKCGVEYASIGAHVQSFKDPKTEYVCLSCRVKREES